MPDRNARDAIPAELAVQEHRSRLSHELTAALSSAATRAQVARAVFEKGLPVFGADAGTLILVREENREEVELVEQIGYPDAILDPWRRFSMSLRTPITEAIRSRGPVWSESREALFRFPDFRPVWHAAWAALPLCVGDRAVGAIGLAYGAERGFDAEERALLVSVAQRCALALDRARASDRLREAVERLSIAKEAALLGIYDYDVEAGTFRWDERVREIWGVGPEEPVTYYTFLSGLHPADRRRTEVALAKVFNPSSGGRYDAEHRVVHKRDGDVRWVHATGLAFFERGRAVRLVGTVQEISDEKRVEAHADLLGRLYVALVQHRPPEELVRHTLHELAQHLEVDGAKLCQNRALGRGDRRRGGGGRPRGHAARRGRRRARGRPAGGGPPRARPGRGPRGPRRGPQSAAHAGRGGRRRRRGRRVHERALRRDGRGPPPLPLRDLPPPAPLARGRGAPPARRVQAALPRDRAGAAGGGAAIERRAAPRRQRSLLRHPRGDARGRLRAGPGPSLHVGLQPHGRADGGGDARQEQPRDLLVGGRGPRRAHEARGPGDRRAAQDGRVLPRGRGRSLVRPALPPAPRARARGRALRDGLRRQRSQEHRAGAPRAGAGARGRDEAGAGGARAGRAGRQPGRSSSWPSWGTTCATRSPRSRRRRRS